MDPTTAKTLRSLAFRKSSLGREKSGPCYNQASTHLACTLRSPYGLGRSRAVGNSTIDSSSIDISVNVGHNRYRKTTLPASFGRELEKKKYVLIASPSQPPAEARWLPADCKTVARIVCQSCESRDQYGSKMVKSTHQTPFSAVAFTSLTYNKSVRRSVRIAASRTSGQPAGCVSSSHAAVSNEFSVPSSIYHPLFRPNCSCSQSQETRTRRSSNRNQKPRSRRASSASGMCNC